MRYYYPIKEYSKMEGAVHRMRLSIILPALGLHQLALANELYSKMEQDFYFIATNKIISGRFGINYDEIASKYPYVIKAYESEQTMALAKQVIMKSDVILIGSATKEMRDYAYSNNKALILRYSERVLKRGVFWRFVPTAKKKIYSDFLFNRDKFAVLCASAYLPKDLAYFDKNVKTFKWGYFPECKYLSQKEIKRTDNEVIHILWAGRFINVKKPYDAILLAENLRTEKFKFIIKMVGSGELQEKLVKEVKKRKLEDYVTFTGTKTTDELFCEMKKADIFLFTSNFGEGWGAVLNEAMNAGCACVCSHAPGSVPFIIRDGYNALIYPCGNIKIMTLQTKKLILDQTLRREIGKAAYQTIVDSWNYKVAAQRLIEFSENYLSTGSFKDYEDNILSEAALLSNNWFKGGFR